MTDNEIIDCLLEKMYDNGSYKYFEKGLFNDYLPEELHSWDIDRIENKLFNLNLICNPISNGDILYGIIRISEHGIEIMKEHKSYSNYLKSIEKKHNKERKNKSIDRRISNTNIIISLLILVAGFVLGQFRIWSKSEPNQTEQQVKELSSQNDSLKQVVKTLEKQLDSLLITDTLQH